MSGGGFAAVASNSKSFVHSADASDRASAAQFDSTGMAFNKLH